MFLRMILKYLSCCAGVVVWLISTFVSHCSWVPLSIPKEIEGIRGRSAIIDIVSCNRKVWWEIGLHYFIADEENDVARVPKLLRIRLCRDVIGKRQAPLIIVPHTPIAIIAEKTISRMSS